MAQNGGKPVGTWVSATNLEPIPCPFRFRGGLANLFTFAHSAGRSFLESNESSERLRVSIVAANSTGASMIAKLSCNWRHGQKPNLASCSNHSLGRHHRSDRSYGT